jgi:hypothetical protein
VVALAVVGGGLSSEAEAPDEVYLTVRHVWRVGVQHVRDVKLHYRYVRWLCEKDQRGSCGVRAAIDLLI